MRFSLVSVNQTYTTTNIWQNLLHPLQCDSMVALLVSFHLLSFYFWRNAHIFAPLSTIFFTWHMAHTMAHDCPHCAIVLYKSKGLHILFINSFAQTFTSWLRTLHQLQKFNLGVLISPFSTVRFGSLVVRSHLCTKALTFRLMFWKAASLCPH